MVYNSESTKKPSEGRLLAVPGHLAPLPRGKHLSQDACGPSLTLGIREQTCTVKREDGRGLVFIFSFFR